MPTSAEIRQFQCQTPALGVVATESTLTESRMPCPKPSDLPLPVPVFEHQEAPPIRVQRAAIPESMRNSPPIAGPVVVTVNPAQMMPVSAPQPQPAYSAIQRTRRGERRSARAPAASHRRSRLSTGSVSPETPRTGGAAGAGGPRRQRRGSENCSRNFVLGRAAIAAVKQWRFQPYTLNGHAAATQTVITINFSYPPG
jgi:hypothetical protein